MTRLRHRIKPVLLLCCLAAFSAVATEEIFICIAPEARIYLKPGKPDKSLGRIRFSEPVVNLGRQGYWRKIFRDSQTVGWVENYNLQATITFRRKYPHIKYEQKEVEALLLRLSQYAGERTDSSTIFNREIRFINGSNVNIRQGPDTNAGVMGQTDFGHDFEIISEDEHWCEVLLEKKKKGWIAKSMLSSKDDIKKLLKRKKTTGKTLVTAVKYLHPSVKTNLNLRGYPSIIAKRKGQVTSRDTLYSTLRFGEWERVYSLKHGSGWVYSRYLKKHPALTQQFQGFTLRKLKAGARPLPGTAFPATLPASENRINEKQRGQARREEARLDGLRLSLEDKARELKDRIKNEIAEKESLMMARLSAARKQQTNSMAKYKTRLQEAAAILEKKQQVRNIQLKQKENEWRGEQEQWLAGQKKQLEELQLQKEKRLKEQQVELDRQRLGIKRLAQEMEMKNLQARREMEQIKESLEAEIKRFEEAKKEALVLKEEESDLEDEDFFFDEEVTGVLERKMDEVDSVQVMAEAEIARNKDMLSREKEEWETYQAEMEAKMKKEKSSLESARKAVDEKKQKLESKFTEMQAQLEKEKAARDSELAAKLEKEKAANTKELEKEQQALNKQRRNLEQKEKALEDSLASLEKDFKQQIEKEKARLEAEARLTRARMEDEMRQKADAADSLQAVERLALFSERTRLDSLKTALAEEARKKLLEKEDKMQAALKEATQKMQLEIDKNREKMAEEQLRLDSIKRVMANKSAIELAKKEKALKKREQEARKQLKREKAKALDSLMQEKTRIESEKKAFKERQQKMEEERKKKKAEWRRDEEKWLDHQKAELAKLQQDRENQLKRQQERLAAQRAEMETFSKDMEEKNRRAQEKIEKLRKELEEEMQKFEEAKKQSVALKEEEEDMEDEDFFFDDNATEILEEKMDVIDSVKLAAQQEIDKEKTAMNFQKLEMEKQQQEMAARMEEERKRIGLEKQKADSIKQKARTDLALAKLKMEANRKKREQDFQRKLQAEEAENQKQLKADKARLELERNKLQKRQRQIEDSLNQARAKALQEIEKERNSFEAELEAASREQTRRIEAERTALSQRQKLLEDSLKLAEQKARKKIDAERRQFKALLQKEADAEKQKIEAERLDITEKEKEIAEREAKLEERKKSLDDEWKKLKKQQEAMGSPGPGDVSRHSGAMGNDFNKFLTSMKSQMEKSSRDFSEITRVLSERVAKTMQTYSKMLKKQPDLGGKIILTFIIQSSGKVTNLKIITNTVKNQKLEKIVLKKFSACQFKTLEKEEKPVLVNYPLLFFPR